MHNPRLLLIGATGTIGTELSRQLVASGARVRVMSRRPNEARLPTDVEPMYGDLTLPESLDGALTAVDAVFLIWTAPADTLDEVARRIADRVDRLVLLTSPHQTPHPFFRQPNAMAVLHARIERAMTDAGLALTILRPGIFASNAEPWWSEQIRAGDVVRWPLANAETAPVDERDIAAVAALALRKDECIGQEYVLTGPEPISQEAQVRTIGEVLGRRLLFEEISPEQFHQQLDSRYPPASLDMLLNAWRASLGHPAYVTSTVAELTAKPARSFQEWAADHAAVFQ